MKKRIVNNWRSTLTGLFITGICVYLIVIGKATFQECSGFFVASGLMAWVKDSIFKVNPDNDKSTDNQ